MINMIFRMERRDSRIAEWLIVLVFLNTEVRYVGVLFRPEVRYVGVLFRPEASEAAAAGQPARPAAALPSCNRE